MRYIAEKLFTASVLVLALSLTAACGSSDNGSSSPSASATPTPAPQPTSSLHTLAVGDTVAYIGPRGAGVFSNKNVAYVGTVEAIAQDVLVAWNNNLGNQTVSSTVITPQVTLSPDLTNHRVQYVGQRGPSIANFTDPSHFYWGTVVATYALGYFEVRWDDFSSYTTIEPGANLSISQ